MTPNSKAVTDNCPQQIFSKAVRSMHLRRNAPPPIPIPVNPTQNIMQTAHPTPNTLPLIAVELSQYPPSLTRQEIHELFEDFVISPDFTLPSMTRFLFPFRTCVRVAGEEEARRAVKELSGNIIGGRQIRVMLADSTSYEQQEIVVEELADGLKIAIANTARIHDPNLTEKILEIREHVEGATHYAFLQARDPVTIYSEPGAHFQSVRNTAEWDLVAGSRADGLGARSRDRSMRLAALKSLQEIVERQGMCKKVWGKWEGSHILDLMPEKCQ